MTQGIQTAPLAPTTTESRAEALRRRLRSRGGTVKRTAFGQVNWRGAGYGERILHYGIEAGWLVEDSRRKVPFGSGEEVTYRYVETAKALARPSAADTPARPSAREGRRETKRRPPRTTRRARAQTTSSYPTTPQPLDGTIECISRDDAAQRWGISLSALRAAIRNKRIDTGEPYRPASATGPPRIPVALTEKTVAYATLVWVLGETPPPSGTRRRGTSLPAEPPPLADGTECISRDAAAERFGCTPKALQQAVYNGRIDSGDPYLPEGARGGPRVPVALTDKTQRYAERVWVQGEKMAFRDDAQCGRQGPRPELRRLDDGRVSLVRGSEMLKRQVAEAFGYKAPNAPAFARTIERVPSRYVSEANPRRGRLFRVGRELVEAGACLGVTVELIDASAADASKTADAT